MTSATYQVTGLTCEHCVHAVASEHKILDDLAGGRGTQPFGMKIFPERAVVHVTRQAKG